jgi:hypothetical protein
MIVVHDLHLTQFDGHSAEKSLKMNGLYFSRQICKIEANKAQFWTP